MGKEKNYRIDELASLFNTNRRQIFRLINAGYLRRIKSKVGIFIDKNSVKKYLGIYIRNCSLPIFTSRQISQHFNIPIRKIYDLLKNGKIDYIKVNPESKNNKAIRIPLDSDKNYYVFSYRELPPDIKLVPSLLKKQDAAEKLGISMYKLQHLCNHNKLRMHNRHPGKKGLRIFVESIIKYMEEIGYDEVKIEKALGFSKREYNLQKELLGF